MEISVLIAIIGFIASFITAYFTAIKAIKTEKDKINSTKELTYTNNILNRRIEIYPQCYFILSEMAKKLFYNNYVFKDVLIFQKKIDKFDSNNVLFFSSRSTYELGCLRRYLRSITTLSEKEAGQFPEDFKIRLFDLIGKVENSLKQDIGIYIVEFDDPQKIVDVSNYEIINKRIAKERKDPN